MSMRIHSEGIAAAAASPAAQAESPAKTGSSAQTGSGPNSVADRVDISSLSGNVAASVAALASQQAARVSQLAALYAKGEYSGDSLQLSRALVSQAISGGPVGEDG
jgi:hypothetical protein